MIPHMDDYTTFLDAKRQLSGNHGFDPVGLNPALFPFQADIVRWALRKGRAAIFADCGLGKTPMQLDWADQVVRRTNGRVLILTPLAVSHQTLAEGAKFNIECHRSIHGELHPGINIINYERLHLLNPSDFVGAVCDESSILKSFDGVRRGEITDFMRKMPYRLLATATAAPNDYIELGTSSEALGELGHMDMLTRFFRNEQNNSSHRVAHRARHFHVEPGKQWRFKGHARVPFWRWVCSWARAIRRPSDLGHPDDDFILPPLEEQEHMVAPNTLAPGMLFPLPAVGLKEQREERRRTIQERCERVASLVCDTGQPAIVWCHLNDEGDKLEAMIPDCVQVSGDDSDDAKEEKLLAFAHNQVRVLVTKPKIGAWGLNFQHCAHVTFFPSHSFEQYYQGVRRCWRFGQTRPVHVDIVTTEGERGVMDNLQRKAKAADEMFSSLVGEMNHSLSIQRGIDFSEQEEVPSWL